MSSFRYCYGKVDVIIVTLFTDPPVVSLSLGSNLEAGDIKEGDDVYFECKVTAKPPAFKIDWKYNVSNHLTPILLFAKFGFYF